MKYLKIVVGLIAIGSGVYAQGDTVRIRADGGPHSDYGYSVKDGSCYLF